MNSTQIQRKNCVRRTKPFSSGGWSPNIYLLMNKTKWLVTTLTQNTQHNTHRDRHIDESNFLHLPPRSWGADAALPEPPPPPHQVCDVAMAVVVKGEICCVLPPLFVNSPWGVVVDAPLACLCEERNGYLWRWWWWCGNEKRGWMRKKESLISGYNSLCISILDGWRLYTTPSQTPSTHPGPVSRGQANALFGAVMAASLITPCLAVSGQPSVGEASQWVPPVVLPHIHVPYVTQEVIPRLTVAAAAWGGGWWTDY